MADPRTGSACTVIVNWNGWGDTLECLESLFRSRMAPFPVVVCDNGSSDDSLHHIRAWAEGRLDVWSPAAGEVRQHSYPPVPKPVAYVQYDRAAAEAGGEPSDRSTPLVLIRAGANLGFAGGNNVALRYLLARGDREFVWLLNNDTVVHPEALGRLVEEAQRSPDIGLVGSRLLYYDAPDVVQTLGGARYNRWLALSHHIGALAPASRPMSREEVVRRMDYVVGASMLVTRRFLEDVGLLAEDYFLYFEELDWAMRARGRFRLAYAPDSVVYHKEGRSIGGEGRDPRNKSWTSDYHFIRNRILFTRRFMPLSLPTVYLALAVAMLRRAGRRQWGRAWMIAKLCTKG